MSTPLYPFTFQPIFKERVWGGRRLETLYGKPLPPNIPIGESWEISDRPGDASVIANGPLAGKDLRWLMENHAAEILGNTKAPGGRYPLLIKALDACEKLSLQVHPPASIAPKLGGEPKTEMWYVADTTPEADIFAGLKQGITRDDFERGIAAGTVDQCFHRIPVKAGDVMFIPSGRVHALGAGSVIFEVQQNSDTTYRVSDWNRTGLDGKPRELHVAQSLASIDFNDFEPKLASGIYSRNPTLKVRFMVDDPLFRVDGCLVKRGQRYYMSSAVSQILGLIRGKLHLSYQGQELDLVAGQFCLLPASLQRVVVVAETQTEYLHIQAF